MCLPKEERTMADITYVQQLRKTVSGEFYFGAMCRETKRRIAISIDTSRGKQRYSQSGETIVSCNLKKSTGSTTATYSLFSKLDGNNHPPRQICWVTVDRRQRDWRRTHGECREQRNRGCHGGITTSLARICDMRGASLNTGEHGAPG